MSSNLNDVPPSMRKARAKILLAYGLDEAGQDLPPSGKSDSLEGLNLETQGQSLEKGRERATQLDQEIRGKAIEEARQAAETLRKSVDELRVKGVDLLGEDHVAIGELDKRLQAESSSRTSAKFSLTEPSWDEFQKAKKGSADARRELEVAGEELQKAIDVECERRKLELQTIVEKLKVEPLSTMKTVYGRCKKFLAESSPLPPQLLEHGRKLASARDEVSKLCNSGGPQPFNAAVGTFNEEFRATVKSLEAVVKAESDERERRNQEVVRLKNLITDPRFSTLEDIKKQLSESSLKNDPRLTPFATTLNEAHEKHNAALRTLDESLAGDYKAFESAAREVGGTCDNVALALQKATVEITERKSFFQFSNANKEVLQWGEKAVYKDARVDTFKTDWSQCKSGKVWSAIVAQFLMPLTNHIGNLNAAKLDFEKLDEDAKIALERLQDAETKNGEIVKYCEKLELDPNSIEETYPKASALHAKVADYSASGDKLSVESLSEFFPDYSLARAEVTRIVKTWTDLIADAKDELAILKQKFAEAPLVKGAVVIIWTATLKKKEIVDKLPSDCGNSDRIAGDILNHPTSGQTGFTVKGRTVYHSSAGSGSQSQASMGTAFWILQGDANSPREVIAMGKHDKDSGQSDEYVIQWIASGVTAYKNEKNQKVVKLNDGTKKLS